jgi:hypothetical protein
VLTAVVLLVVVLVFLQRAAVAPAAEGSFG